jgi:hypothetical protein
MFFEVFQASIDDLLHPKHFGAEQISDIVDVAICVCKTSINLGETNIDGPRKIVQALIIDQYADQHGNRGESGCGKRRHQLIGNSHSFTNLPDEFLRAVPFVVAVENMNHANFLHRDRR